MAARGFVARGSRRFRIDDGHRRSPRCARLATSRETTPLAAWSRSPDTSCSGDTTSYHLGVAMTLRLSPEDERLLAALPEAEGVSRHEATLRAIREAAARHGHENEVAKLSARARERYADVLDRLGR